MPRAAEPEIVTLTKMTGNLAERVATAENALADTEAAIVAATQAAEHGDDEALRRLAAAEQRREKQSRELERLRTAGADLERQLVTEREEADASAQRELLREYIAHRDAVGAACLAMLEAIEALAPQAAEARAHGQAANRTSAELHGFTDERGAFVPKLRFVTAALGAVLQGADGQLAEARAAIVHSWRDTPNGRRATALEAALGDGDGAK